MIAPTTQLSWPNAYRIVTSPSAPIAALSNLVARSEDLEELLEIEAITNPVARLARKGIANIPPEERIFGPGAALIMTPFVLPTVSRFSDGSFGVFYAGDELRTAGEERAYHLTQRLRESHEGQIVLRTEGYAYSVEVDCVLHDERRSATPAPPPEIYDLDSYDAAQRHGGLLRAEGSHGLVYESVRRPGFECAGIFRPKCIGNPRPAGVVYFDWDGAELTVVTV
ncbi:RES domain-containing protein [bacterium]|nr:MAG: RES domain-containing protein [bacterium]